MDGLDKLDLNFIYECNHSSMHGNNIGIKRNIIKINSSSLSYKRLAHISLEKVKRLVNDKILKDIGYTDLKLVFVI